MSFGLNRKKDSDINKLLAKIKVIRLHKRNLAAGRVDGGTGGFYPYLPMATNAPCSYFWGGGQLKV